MPEEIREELSVPEISEMIQLIERHINEFGKGHYSTESHLLMLNNLRKKFIELHPTLGVKN